MALTTETDAGDRDVDCRDAGRADAGAASRREPDAAGAAEARDVGRRGGARVWLALVLVVLAAAGWVYRDALRERLGLAPAAPPVTGAADAAPADPDRVTLDAAGQKRIGLAFGTAETRRIVLPLRVPGTVAFDERRVTHLKPRTQ